MTPKTQSVILSLLLFFGCGWERIGGDPLRLLRSTWGYICDHEVKGTIAWDVHDSDLYHAYAGNAAKDFDSFDSAKEWVESVSK